YNYEQLPGKSALGELVADVSAPLLGKLGLANIVVARIIPELAHYWDVSSQFYQQASSRMLQTLQSVLSNDSRVMTIAHGLGGVIAYDALWHLSQGTAGAGGLREHKVDRFITLGTPLADDTVRGRLAGQDEVAAQRYPCNIVNWYNVAAEDDYLCHDKTVADDFSAMLAQHVISLIEDFRIYNLSVRYGKSNPHSAVGYLAHPRMTRLLVDWLR
ncbi:MAG: hypothetical protein HKN49_03415, partial [Gammaproteobacteria bacterium]|nr:hypothetical protein [Gammaproteobacteria bacterium]